MGTLTALSVNWPTSAHDRQACFEGALQICVLRCTMLHASIAVRCDVVQLTEKWMAYRRVFLVQMQGLHAACVEVQTGLISHLARQVHTLNSLRTGLREAPPINMWVHGTNLEW